MFSKDELRLLAPIVDEFYLGTKNYANLLEDILVEFSDPKEALIDFLVYIVLGSPKDTECAVDQFFEIPLDQMPLYFIPRPLSQLKIATCGCPSLSEGPYPWQSFLAFWRVKIQK